MIKKIRYIKPSAYDALNTDIKTYLDNYSGSDTVVEVVSMPRGPKNLEYVYYQVLASQEILKAVKQAEKDGCDAAIIGCFDDPALIAAREISEKMLIIGPGESSMQLAATLGGKFSIIIGHDKWAPQIMDNVHRYGFINKLASFRTLNLGVNQLHQDEALTEQRIREGIKKAITDDKAEVIVLGCTMGFGFYKEMQKEFCLPIIDVMLSALKHAEMLVEMKQKMGWFTSKVCTYASPPLSEIHEWNLPADYDMTSIWPN
jgi:allantoin racemase